MSEQVDCVVFIGKVSWNITLVKIYETFRFRLGPIDDKVEVVGHQGEGQNVGPSRKGTYGNVVHSGYVITTVSENEVVFQSFDVDVIKAGVGSAFHVGIN